MTLAITFRKPAKGERMSCHDIRRPIQQVAEAILKNCELRPYEIQHSLEALEVFWVGIVNRTRKLEDYSTYFGDK